MTANRKERSSGRIFSYNFGFKKKALNDFHASSSSSKIANTGKSAVVDFGHFLDYFAKKPIITILSCYSVYHIAAD